MFSESCYLTYNEVSVIMVNVMASLETLCLDISRLWHHNIRPNDTEKNDNEQSYVLLFLYSLDITTYEQFLCDILLNIIMPDVQVLSVNLLRVILLSVTLLSFF
jgi:hypothetical protein